MRDPEASGGDGIARPLRALGVYLAVVFFGAAAVAPWLWRAAQWLAREHGMGAGLAAQPFHRYVHRCLLVLALALLWPLVREFRLRTWAEVGWRWDAGERRRWVAAFLLGLVALGAAAAVAVAGGGRTWSVTGGAGPWIGRVAAAAGTAVVVSVLEELLFRGAVFGGLRRHGGFAVAATVTSAAYAWVHFFERPAPPLAIDAWSGFRTLGEMLGGFADPRALVPGLGSLFVAGWTLAILRERTGGLAAAMGLHAGWIFWLRAYGWMTAAVPGADPRWWGSGRLYDGWIAFGLLAGLAIWVHVRTQPTDHDPKSSRPDN
ncbi:MAG: CPBP family intramembrane metalloprotease [Verrucomicrobia bacterium]|nr:MAG: CPBP family intramembrane metalloprotease [Verrucomicrobiota bacterium]